VPETPPAAPDRGTVRLALVVGGLVLAVLLGFGLGRLDTAPSASGAMGAAVEASDPAHAPGTGAHQHGAAADQPAAGEVGGWRSAPPDTLAPLADRSPPDGPASSWFR
jgi:hypothetical protein